MELDELARRLGPFCEAKCGSGAQVFDVVQMPGHAGFAYGFRVRRGRRGWRPGSSACRRPT